MTEEEDVVFELPLPPPGFPPPPPPPLPPGPHRRVLYVRRDGEEGGRESEDIMLRRVPSETAMRFRAAAGGRGLTHAQYLAALVALHESARTLAEAGNEQLAGELERLGLQTVTV